MEDSSEKRAEEIIRAYESQGLSGLCSSLAR